MDVISYICAFVLQYVTCVVSYSSCPTDCQCSHTSTGHLDVVCKGASLSSITSLLPPQTVMYKYEAQEQEVDLGGTNFSHLTSLESLQITSRFDDLLLDRVIKEIHPDQQTIFWPLQTLKELRININWELRTALPELFSKSERLEVLDLSDTRKLSYKNLQHTLVGLNNSISFRSLNLHNTQTLEHLYNGFTLHLRDLLDPLKDCPLEELDISYNALRTIIPGLISKAPRLKKVIASNNLLVPLWHGAFFMEVFLHPNIEEADFSKQGLSPGTFRRSSNDIMEKRIKSLQNGSRLAEEAPTNSGAEIYEMYYENKICLDQVLGNLCSLFLPACRSFLESCTANHQMFCDLVAIFVPNSGAIPCKYIPPIHDMFNQSCGGCWVFPWTGSLKRAYIHTTNYYDEYMAHALFKGTTCHHRNNSVEVFDFSNNRKSGLADIDVTFSTPIVGWDKMKVLNISYDELQHPSSDLGYNLPQIEVLDLSHNLLDLQGQYGEFLEGATSVQELNLAGNVVQNISYGRFSTLSKLETLNLSSNALESFVVDIRNLNKLSYIDLSGNKISSFTRDMTEQLSAQADKLKSTTLKIDLSRNSLLCTCSVRPFVDWVLSKPYNIKFVNFNDYLCWNDDSSQELFHKLGKPTELDCLGKNFYISVGVASGIVLSSIIASLIIWVYRKRWWIRYHYFIARQMWINRGKQDEQGREFRYDLFVAHSSCNQGWVDEVLQPKLEDENGIKLCLHQRDFELGGHITDLIIDSMENSRKILLLLSPHFIKSHWCKFEMSMAIWKLIRKGHGVLLLAILEPLDGVRISKTLRELLEQRNYGEWTNDQYGQKLFWAKLLAALNSPERPKAASGTAEDNNTGVSNAAFEDAEAAAMPSTSHTPTQLFTATEAESPMTSKASLAQVCDL